MDPLTMLESKELIKRTMSDCVNVLNNPDERSILLLAQAVYNTNALLDALIEGIIQDQIK